MSELSELRSELADVEARIERIEAKAVDDGLTEHFHLGRVGGSGKAVLKLDKNRTRDIVRMIEMSRELVPLYEKRDRLKRQIVDHDSGKVARRQAAKEAAAERVRNAEVDDRVFDSAYGMATVVRVNRKSLTIQTDSGYREAREFSLILDVVKS